MYNWYKTKQKTKTKNDVTGTVTWALTEQCLFAQEAQNVFVFFPKRIKFMTSQFSLNLCVNESASQQCQD